MAPWSARAPVIRGTYFKPYKPLGTKQFNTNRLHHYGRYRFLEYIRHGDDGVDASAYIVDLHHQQFSLRKLPDTAQKGGFAKHDDIGRALSGTPPMFSPKPIVKGTASAVETDFGRR